MMSRQDALIVGGKEDDPLWAKMYVDDLVMVMIAWSNAVLLDATKHAASEHMRLLGVPQTGLPCVVPKKKMTDWDSKLEVLGWMVDTDNMVITMSAIKLKKLNELLDE